MTEQTEDRTTVDTRRIKTAVLCALFLGAGVVVGSIAAERELSSERDKVRAERNQLVSDMADAFDKVCAGATADPLSTPKAYTCLGGLHLMIETIDVRRKREASGA